MEELARLLAQYYSMNDDSWDPTVTKRCVFCGDNPVSKNREHIFPRWLIDYTGDPKRLMRLPVFDYENDTVSTRQMAFDQFVFPACEACNNKFAELEGKAKRAFLWLFEKRETDSQCAEILLNWFDKVRVGLWLAAQVWNNAPVFIHPKFHIRDRIAKHDRILWFSSCKQSLNGLRFVGLGDPIFKCMPSCFSLRVNNMTFVSASLHGICAGALGLPRVKIQRFIDDMHADVEVVMPKRGKRSNWPAAPAKFHILAQACYNHLLRDTEIEDRISDRMIDKSKSKPHLYRNDCLECLDDSVVKLALSEYTSSEDLTQAELRLYSKLRRYLVKSMPNHAWKSHRVWKKAMEAMLRQFPYEPSEVRKKLTGEPE